MSVDKASLRRLKFCNFKLDILLNVTQAINENAPTDELLNRYEHLLRHELNIGKVLVYSHNKIWKRILRSGFSNQIVEHIDVERELMQFTDITTTSSCENDFVRTFDIIIPVYNNNTALAFVLIGDIDEEQEGISPTIKHLLFIQTLTNIIMVAVENKRLYQESIRQEAIRKELELASKMQAMLIPNLNSLPDNEYIFVDAYYFPHYEVGGDYYDFLKLSDTEFGFCIADVSGKGISAALLMSNFQANLRALFHLEDSLTSLVKKLNQRVISTTQADKFITMFVGKYNVKHKTLSFINAGHNPPLLFDKKNSTLRYLKTGCVGLGMFDEIPSIEENTLHLDSEANGSKLLCYTDGLVEIKNENRVEYGTQAIEAFVSDNSRIDKNINEIILKLSIKKDNDSIFDDISMLGLEFYG